MRANANVQINGASVVLVPYREHHVSKYHSWMEDAELRESTASERLSIEEEYQMQSSWAEDEDKCTFIVLDATKFVAAGDNDIEGMVGDVNLFFNDEAPSTAEIEVMIAEQKSRRKGLAAEALSIMMSYAHRHLGVTVFRAKVGFTNVASSALFHKLGYVETCRSELFQEATLELAVSRSDHSLAWSADWERCEYVQKPS